MFHYLKIYVALFQTTSWCSGHYREKHRFNRGFMDISSISDSTLRGGRSRATLGLIEILFGGLGIVVEVIFFVTHRQCYGATYLESYIILQMILGIVNCLVIVNMVFNIVSAVECIIWGIFLGIVTSYSWSYRWYYWHPTGFYLVTLSFLDMVLLLNFLTAVIGASFTCTAFCPCVAVNTEGQYLVYNNAFRTTPHVPPVHDDTTSPLMEPNLDPACAGITSFKASSYGAV